LKNEYDVSVQWRAFPLHPETPEEGISLEELFAAHSINLHETMLKLRETAAGFGMPFGESTFIYNTRLAQELGLWAESKNEGDKFHLAAFKAYFVDGKNLAKIPVLLELASSIGLPADEAAEILTTRKFKTAVDADWELSKEKSIMAVPTFVMNQDRLVGAQPYRSLEMMLEKNGLRKRED
jgi:predicted DsbA family dithiol-disulfide isomerase